MSPITTHVLDTASGRPAQGVPVTLELQTDSQWLLLAENQTNADGRILDLLPESPPLKKGVYRITFETGTYFQTQNLTTFYPYASIVFEITEPNEHYHVPLLLSGYGYSTYRGS